MNNIKIGLNDLDAETVFRNADKEHFIRFVSNGTVSEDFNATFTGLKDIYMKMPVVFSQVKITGCCLPVWFCLPAISVKKQQALRKVPLKSRE